MYLVLEKNNYKFQINLIVSPRKADLQHTQ